MTTNKTYEFGETKAHAITQQQNNKHPQRQTETNNEPITSTTPQPSTRKQTFGFLGANL